MAAQPPRPPWESGAPGDGQGRPQEDRAPATSATWRRYCAGAWSRLRTLPSWVQFLLWLAAWPAVTALYLASNRRLGILAAPLMAGVLLLGGPVWWSVLTAGGVPAGAGTTEAVVPREPPAGGALGTLGTMTLAGAAAGAGEPVEFDPQTLDIEIAECVQTRSRSTVRERTIRQPRIVVRVTNRGPARTVLLQGAVLLEDYDWNGGWKPTAEVELELGADQASDAMLLTDYRHQSNYSPDGLHACRLIDLGIVAPQVWPERPARQRLPVETGPVVGSERDFDPQRDLLRTDTR